MLDLTLLRPRSLAMILHGMERVSESSQSDMAKKSRFKIITVLVWIQQTSFVLFETRFGHAFLMDTGTSTGEIIGHSKVGPAIQLWNSDSLLMNLFFQAINAVSIRHQRPFRAATASDDSMIIFYTGAPYKYEKVSLYSPTSFSLVLLLWTSHLISCTSRSEHTANLFTMWNIRHLEIILRVWALIQSSSYMMEKQATPWLNSRIVLIKGASYVFFIFFFSSCTLCAINTFVV